MKKQKKEKVEVKELINEIKQSPVYNMSLHNKELFHSNFWKWLMEIDSEFIKIFFKEIKNLNNDKNIILREYEHTDLSLKILNNKDKMEYDVYVIENKFQSLPNKEQLEKYTENIEFESNKKKGKIRTKDTFKEGYLISFIKPSFFYKNDSIEVGENKKKWTYISYIEIIKKIKIIMQKYKKKNSYYYGLISDYTEMLENTIKIVKKELGYQSNNFEKGSKIAFKFDLDKEKNEKEPKEDNTIKYLIKKMRFMAFAEYIRKDVQGNNGWYIEKVAMSENSKGKAFLTINKVINEDKNKKVGIEIQSDGRYAYFRSIIKDKANENEKFLNELYRDEENKKWIENGTKGKGNKEHKEYQCNVYSTKKYDMIYKYKEIVTSPCKDSDKIYAKTFSDLKIKILSDIKIFEENTKVQK